MSDGETRERLEGKLKTLSEELWEDQCSYPDIEEWLSNFRGRILDQRAEHLHALHLLSSFSYFGAKELRILLISMYRDLFRYPIVQEIRERLAGTRDEKAIQDEFAKELDRTRFLGMGNPSESGTYLLYQFRQENALPLALFSQESGICEEVSRKALCPTTHVKRIIFIDDLCASGTQATRYARRAIANVQDAIPAGGHVPQHLLLVLFATTRGLRKVRRDSGLDCIRVVNELDDTQVIYGSNSRIFRRKLAGIRKDRSRQVAEGYGRQLNPRAPLGFGDCQLLLGFHHNIPNNTLPIIWSKNEEVGWNPAFPRHSKK